MMKSYFRNANLTLMLKFNANVTSLSTIIFTLIGMFLYMSLANFAAFSITSIVKILLFSTLILRFLESSFQSIMSTRYFSAFSMASSMFAISVVGIFLEILSLGFRSISLGFRIFANVAAGHVLSDIFGVAKFLQPSSFLAIIVNSVHQFLVLTYELGVSAIQTGVFLALVGVYAA